MATKTQHPPPFSRFSRIGFGLSPKFNSAAARPRKNKQGGAEEEWYIPYNGPYEPPPEAPRKVRERDSWGDVVLEQALDNVPALSSDLHKRHGGQHDTPAEDSTRVAWKNGNASSDDDRRVQGPGPSRSCLAGQYRRAQRTIVDLAFPSSVGRQSHLRIVLLLCPTSTWMLRAVLASPRCPRIVLRRKVAPRNAQVSLISVGKHGRCP
jgi:hypothetical protein